MGSGAFPADHIKHQDFEFEGLGPYCDFQIISTGADQQIDLGAIAYTINVGGLRP